MKFREDGLVAPGAPLCNSTAARTSYYTLLRATLDLNSRTYPGKAYVSTHSPRTRRMKRDMASDSSIHDLMIFHRATPRGD